MNKKIDREILEKRRGNRSQSFFMAFTRFFGDKFADLLYRNNFLSPNKVSMLSFLAMIASSVFIIQDNYLLSGFMFYISFILDCADGELARLNNIASVKGAWIDVISGEIGLVIFQISVIYSYFSGMKEEFLVPALVLFMFSKYSYIQFTSNTITQIGGGDVFEKYAINPIRKIFKKIIIFFKFKREDSQDQNLEKKQMHKSLGYLVLFPIILVLTNQIFLLILFYIFFY